MTNQQDTKDENEAWYKKLEQDQQDTKDEIKAEEYFSRMHKEYDLKWKSEHRLINRLRAFFGFPTK